MAKKKSGSGGESKKKAGPERETSSARKKTPLDHAEDLKKKFDAEGISGVFSSIAPLLQTLQAAAEEAGTAAAAAGATAVGRAKEALHGTACVECGTRLPTTAKFCLECGAEVPKEKRCTNCGVSLTGATKFCPECGTKA